MSEVAGFWDWSMGDGNLWANVGHQRGVYGIVQPFPNYFGKSCYNFIIDTILSDTGVTSEMLIVLQQFYCSYTLADSTESFQTTEKMLEFYDVSPIPSNHYITSRLASCILFRTHTVYLESTLYLPTGPRMWNGLPPGVRQLGMSFDSFR